MIRWQFSDYIAAIASDKVLIQRIFFGLALYILILDYRLHLLLHQIGYQPLPDQELDPVYWLAMIGKLPQAVAGPAALYFDALLFLSCIASAIWVKHRLFPFLFFIAHFIYFIVYNMLAGHHYTNIGLVFMSFPFIFSSPRRFSYAFAFCRFVFCFMMLSAGLWKLIRGNLFYPGQTYMMLINFHLDRFINKDNSLFFGLIRWLLHHPQIAHLIWITLIGLEVVFITGFITLKRDRLLLICYLLFFAGGWYLFGIYNYENLLFLLTLTPAINLMNKLNFRLKRQPGPVTGG